MSAFLISLVPVVNIGTWTGDSQGARFVYLSSAFSSIIIMHLFWFLIENKKYFVIFSSIVLIFCQISLFYVNKNWNTAGNISKNVISSIQGIGNTNTLCIMNIPDNIRGAYIYRNGFREALYLFAPKVKFTDLCICLYHNVFAENDLITVMKTLGTNTYNIKLSDKMAFFYPLNMFNRRRSACIVGDPKIINSLNNSYAIIVLKEFRKEDKLMFYSKGAMELFGLCASNRLH